MIIFNEDKLVKNTSELTLYHISQENHDGKIFYPKLPDGIHYSLNPFKNINENQFIKRTCFSSSIEKCITGIQTARVIIDIKYYVHIIENQDKIKIYKPTSRDVFDAEVNDEYWVKQPVKLKCIGRILVYDIYRDRQYFTPVRDNRFNSKIVAFYPKYKYKWIERI